MTEPRMLFVKRITSIWSAYLPLWSVASVMWCANSVLLLGFAQSPRNVWAAVFANLVALLAMLGIGVLWSQLASRMVSERNIPLWSVLLTGATLGAAKGFITYSLVWSTDEYSFSISELALNSIPAIVTGLWLVPALGIVGSLRQEYSQERELLINEIVRHELSAAPEHYINQDVAEFVKRATSQLNLANESSESFHAKLIDLAERDVRPMSHKLWEQQEARIESFRFRDLVISAMTEHRFPAFWTSVSLYVSLLMLHVPLVGFSEAFLRTSVQTLIAYGLLLAGSLLPWRGRISGPVIFFGIPVVIVAVIEYVTVSVFGPIPGINALIADSSLYIGLITTLLILGSAFSARHHHVEMASELTELRKRSVTSDANRIIHLIRQRETAEMLHGYVQNQLLTNAIRLQESPESLPLVKDSIAEILANLNAGAVPHTQTPGTVEEIAQEFHRTWEGIMQVNLEIEESETLTVDELAIIDRLGAELVANAHRHGSASTFTFHIAVSEESIFLEALDDGSAKHSGPAGLGTALIHSLSAGNWSREPRRDIPGMRVTCSIPRTPVS